MAEHQDGSDEERDIRYKTPAEKSMQEMLTADKTDESLESYKKALIPDPEAIPFPDDPRRVIVKKLALVTDDRPEMEMDLSGDLSSLRKSPFIMKEGAKYCIKIYFYVQREIVTGLKFQQTSYRKGIKVDKMDLMVGSYGPKMELQSYRTPQEEAPHGMLYRGTYNMKSLFTDDDKNEHLKWEWSIEIKKDWA